MRVYHKTFHADAILANGFKDATGTFLTNSLHTGVWVSDVPLDVNGGAAGDVLLALDVPEEELGAWEWVEDGKPYREFLCPAELLNRFGPPEVVESDYPETRERFDRLIIQLEARADANNWAARKVARMKSSAAFLERHCLLR